jgi:hypothetical protein
MIFRTGLGIEAIIREARAVLTSLPNRVKLGGGAR